jgi:hypothetical protein
MIVRAGTGIIISDQSHGVTAAIVCVPCLITVCIRIPECAFRLIVPEVIEIVPGRIIGKIESKIDGFALIQNILDVGYGRLLRNVRSGNCGLLYGCDGIVEGSGNIAARHIGYATVVTALKLSS